MMLVGFLMRQILKSPVIKVALDRSIISIRDADVSVRLFVFERYRLMESRPLRLTFTICMFNSIFEVTLK